MREPSQRVNASRVLSRSQGLGNHAISSIIYFSLLATPLVLLYLFVSFAVGSQQMACVANYSQPWRARPQYLSTNKFFWIQPSTAFYPILFLLVCFLLACLDFCCWFLTNGLRYKFCLALACWTAVPIRQQAYLGYMAFKMHQGVKWKVNKGILD